MGRPSMSHPRVGALCLGFVGASLFGGVAVAGGQGPRPVQRPVGEGTVDWTRDVIEAQGVASPRVISPTADWIEGDLAAQADLRSLRNLREVLAAIPLDSERSVADVLKKHGLGATFYVTEGLGFHSGKGH